MNFLRIRQLLVPMGLPVFSNKNRKAPQKGNLVSVKYFVGSVSLSCDLDYRDPGIKALNIFACDLKTDDKEEILNNNHERCYIFSHKLICIFFWGDIGRLARKW